MASWLFGKSNVSQQEVQLNLDRIRFLMEYLEQHILKDKKTVVELLNRELMLKIPTDLSDPEERIWPDPSNGNLAIDFSCHDRTNPTTVGQFSIMGLEQLFRASVIGSAHFFDDGDKSPVLWCFSVETRLGDAPPRAKAVQDAFLKMPGFKTIDIAGEKYLQRLPG